MTPRVHTWPEQLAAYIRSRRDIPFEWGVHDCCRFAAGAVEAMTGVDVMAAFTYTSEAEALALIADAGGLEVLVTAELGAPLPSPAHALRGDAVLAALEEGPTVGVCLGYANAFAGPRGIRYAPRQVVQVAWRIG